MDTQLGNVAYNEFKNLEIKEEFEKIAHQNFNRWTEALQSKDPKKVAEMYAKEDVEFLPTMSREFIRDREGVERYFRHFLTKNPTGNIVTGEEMIHVFSDKMNYRHSGFYNFDIDSKEGDRETIEARFTFTWRKNNKGEWEIVHHHSSVQPII